VVFAIGAKFATKRLPAGKITAICKLLKTPVVLLGDKHDRLVGEKVVAEAGGCVFNACGQFNINQSASLLYQSQKVITHDTGLMHIAAALDKETTTVWGNTVPQFGMTPYYGKSTDKKSFIIETEHLGCRPCSKIGFNRCPRGHFKCMNNISAQQVAAVINTGLQ